MSIHRRHLLTLTASSLAATSLTGCGGDDTDTDSGASPPSPARERPPEPEAWSAPGTEDAQLFPCGVQTGDATPAGVVVSVVTDASRVRVRYVAQSGDAWAPPREAGPFDIADGALRVELDALDADTAYNLVVVDEDTGTRSRVVRFRTAIAAGAPPRVLSFGATSCLAANRPWPTLSAAAGERLDAFLFLGDTVYADDAQGIEGYRRYWRDALGVRGLTDVTASTSMIATWDDHEVDNNWRRDLADPDKVEAATRAFLEHMPQRGGPGPAAGPGAPSSLWRSLAWGDVAEFFVLDCRGERREGVYVSPEQLAWLKDALATSGARFKIVLNSVPITDLTNIFQGVEAEDRWQGYPDQRAEVLAHIVENDIRGVLWVTGDVHYGQVGHVDAEGGLAWDMHEVLVGPGGSQVNVLAAIYPGNPQYEQLIAAWNWCRFDCDPALGTVRVRHFGDDGTALSDWTLTP
jgi:phosphodiesterase/alkaline phosphatase D-like protein